MTQTEHGKPLESNTLEEKRDFKPTDLVADFFQDAIARIAPGFIVLTLYLPGTFVRDLIKESAAIWGGFAIVVAWIVGTLVELVGFSPWAILLHYVNTWTLERKKKWNSERARSFVEKVKTLHDNLLPQLDITKLPPRKGRSFLKFVAEKVMYRGLGVISVLALIRKPTLLPDCPWWCFLGMLILLFFAWWWSHINPHPDQPPSGR